VLENDNENIVCTLQTVSLSEAPSFCSLFYHWDDPTLRESIEVNGHVASITTNLKQAFVALRKDYEEIVLWVDAICINQADKMEKSAQVAMMDQIYSNADSTDVWLGPTADSSDILMSELDTIGVRAREAGLMELGEDEHSKIWQAQQSSSLFLEPRLTAIRDALNMISYENKDNVLYPGLSQFSHRPYWTRVWILQEFSVSKRLRLVCGEASLSFEHFAPAVIFQGWHSVWRGMVHKWDPTLKIDAPPELAEGTGMLSTLIGARRRWLGLPGKLRDTLFELLIRTCLGHIYECNQRASFKEDIVYGLLSMARDREELDVKIDYNKSVKEIFTDTTRALLHLGYMSLLAWNQPPKGLLGLPSWVPDLSSPIRETCGEHRHHKLFSAGGPQSHLFLPTTFPPSMSPSQGLGPLNLTRYPINLVSKVGSLWDADYSYNLTALNTYFSDGEIEDFLSQRPPFTYPFAVGNLLRQSQKRWLEAYWRIPTADQSYSGDRCRATNSLYHSYYQLRMLASSRNPVNSIVQDTEVDGIVNLKLYADMYRICLSYQSLRRPFISEDGYVGLVPAETVPGDLLAVVNGASVPHVFRRQKDDSDGWQLIGEAYIDGLMDGEVITAGIIEPKVFQIY
jgi:Heterokaryon incompatibility protein (HET)